MELLIGMFKDMHDNIDVVYKQEDSCIFKNYIIYLTNVVVESGPDAYAKCFRYLLDVLGILTFLLPCSIPEFDIMNIGKLIRFY